MEMKGLLSLLIPLIEILNIAELDCQNHEVSSEYDENQYT